MNRQLQQGKAGNARCTTESLLNYEVYGSKDGLMFHGKDGAHIHVLCLGCLNRNDHSFRLSISKEGDGVFQAGMVADGIWWWDPCVSETIKKKYCNLYNELQSSMNLF